MRPTITTKVDRWSSARELTHGARNIMRRDTHKVARHEGKALVNTALWEMLDTERARREAANRAANLREQIALALANLDAANASRASEDTLARHAYEQVEIARDGRSQVILDLWLYRAERAERAANYYSHDAHHYRSQVEGLAEQLALLMRDNDLDLDLDFRIDHNARINPDNYLY